MNREILFRGMRLDGKGWVYGQLAYFFDNPKNAMIMQSCYFGTKDFGEEDEDGNPIMQNELALGGFVNVKPETVGQYTGLTDRNGVKIFEGDKLKSPNAIVNIVVFENSTWGVKYRLGKMGGLNPFSNMNLLYWEVIGNIHTL